MAKKPTVESNTLNDAAKANPASTANNAGPAPMPTTARNTPPANDSARIDVTAGDNGTATDLRDDAAKQETFAQDTTPDKLADAPTPDDGIFMKDGTPVQNDAGEPYTLAMLTDLEKQAAEGKMHQAALTGALAHQEELRKAHDSMARERDAWKEASEKHRLRHEELAKASETIRDAMTPKDSMGLPKVAGLE